MAPFRRFLVVQRLVSTVKDDHAVGSGEEANPLSGCRGGEEIDVCGSFVEMRDVVATRLLLGRAVNAQE